MSNEWNPREFKTSEELLEDISDSMSDMIKTLEESFNSLFEMIDEKLGSAKKQVSDTKVEKNMDKFTKMLKQMGFVSPKAFLFEQLIKLLEPFLMILEPFITLFEILASLFEVFAAEIMKSLFEALQPVFDILIALTPIFKFLGEIIGWLIEIALLPLKLLLENIGVVINWFVGVFKAIGEVLMFIGNIILNIMKFALLPFVLAIYGIGAAIAAVVDFISAALNLLDLFNLFDPTHLLADWNDMMLPIIASLMEPTGMAEGGIAMSPIIREIGEGGEPEAVVPLSKAREMGFGSGSDSDYYQIKMNDKLDELIDMERRKMTVLTRRKFG